MDKENIIRNFSRYAHLYDKYADLQKKAGFYLLSELKQDGFKKILEIGCGTGNYTRLLRSRFPEAAITPVDISDRMITVAREKLRGEKLEFLVQDAENLSLGDTFDLITSNASFQWLADLGGALAGYKGLLKNKGCILFSTFGSLTFNELNTSLKDIFKGAAITAANFITPEQIKILLKNNFRNSKVKEMRRKEVFSNLHDLLRKIKYSGIRGNGLGRQVCLTASSLGKLEENYLKRFKRIEATYQVFLCQGRR